MSRTICPLLILILLVFVRTDEINNLCTNADIASPLCFRLFPERVLSPHDFLLSKQILNTSCFFNQQSDSITLSSFTYNITPISNCDFIPSNTTEFNFGPSVSNCQNLAVLYTNITILERNIFETWYEIQTLQINMNYHLRTIEPGAFENLTKVWNLTISDNPNLGPLQVDTFKGLVALRQLRYLRNNVKHLDTVTIALGSYILPSLTVLDFTGNNISRVEKDDFIYMTNSSLNTLKICLTKTHWIHEQAFQPLTTLVHLDLSKNNLNSATLTKVINRMIEKSSSLTHLSLGGSMLNRDIKPLLEAVAQNGSSIYFLNLQDNHLGLLSPGFFPKMPKLQILDLTNVMIDDLPEGVITYELMPQLQFIYLGKNIFSGLKAYMLTKTISRVFMSYNENDLPWTTFFNIDHQMFLKIPLLNFLDLSGNRLNILRHNLLSNTEQLEVLLLRKTFINEIELGVFDNNNKLYYLDLSFNFFPMVKPFKKDIFRGLENLIALDLSNCQISYIEFEDVFDHLKNLQYLSLRMNSINKISPKLFANIPKLQVIDLRYSILVSWTERIFRNNKQLNHTLLDYNHIQTITDAMLADFMMAKKVTLYSNSIICDCKLMNTIAEVIDHGKSVNDLPFSDEMNTCSNKPGESLRRYLSFVNSSICINTRWISITAISLVILLFTTLATYIIYYYYKYDIHFWFLRTKRKLGLLHYIGSKIADQPENIKYDAFVSYSVEDEKFVEKMVYVLERDCSKFNLCVFERDFKVGDVLTDRILESMESSRRTILVLTESFAKSQWCCWEMYMAQSRSISMTDSDPKDSLILIKKSQIPESLMTPTLRYLMTTRVYLEWHDSPVRQKIFWEQLKNSLKN